MVESIRAIVQKCHAFVNYRLNQFTPHDVIGYLTNALGISILTIGGILLWGPTYSYKTEFTLPITAYDNYMLWVDSA